MIIEGGVRRRDRRIWYVVLGVFVMVFLFTFLTGRFKSDEEVGAANVSKFDAGYIISDYQMSNYNSMSEAEIQAFLTKKNPCGNTNYGDYAFLSERYPNMKWHFENGHFVCLSEERFGEGVSVGEGETAAHIIYQAAQDYRINPQVLIVLLEKEQGLITDTFPNSVQYRSATGYGCPDTAACDTEYYGFRNQVRHAAALFRTVLDGGWTNYPLGNNYIQYNPNAACGGSVVNIRNLATSALYRYTPYQPNAGALAAGYGQAYCGAYGNRNFYLYFEDWFGGVTVEVGISAPSGVKVTQEGNYITVAWNKPENIEFFREVAYRVVIADDKKNEVKVDLNGEMTKYTFRDLPAGIYNAASVEVITIGSSTYERITFEFAVGNIPDAPIDLKVGMKNGGVMVSWAPPANTGGLDIVEYEVVVADVDKREFKTIVSGDENEVVFYGLPLNEYFAASVKAVNKKGGQHSRITFSIQNYQVFKEYSEIYDDFLDMPQDQISKTAVSWAAHNGITDKNTYFDGESPLSRRQAMVLLWRLAGQPESEVYDDFLDMPQDQISKTAVSWAAHNGITDKNTYFDGESPLSRRQAMVLLWRFYGLIDK